jgi:hypothetical protein
VRFRQNRSPANKDELDGQLAFLLRHYVLPRGGWVERLGEDLRPMQGELPASSCYHLMMAFEEVLNLPQL